MTDPVPAAGTAVALDAICRNVLLLLNAADHTPARLRIEAGGACVDLDWRTVTPEAPSSGGVAAPSVPDAVPALGPALRSVVPAGDARRSGFHLVAESVGTFYHAPQPGAAPFVQVGEEVEAGRQVGVLEVMKLMIPVKADRAGRVAEILVPDGEPVEHGQPLIAFVPLDEA
jgi:acetyl-CoA carboxylase biotin carboxyl carrier protein